MPVQTDPVWWQDLLLNMSQGALPAILVAIVGLWQQRALNRYNAALEMFRSSMETRGRYFDRYMTACEELWALLAAAIRAQENLTRAKSRNEKLDDKAKALGEARSQLKNHVYDHGLFFQRETSDLVRELDKALGDPQVDSVDEQLRKLQGHLSKEMRQYMPEPKSQTR